MDEAKLERLAILAEECAEVQQIIMKIIRHGDHSYHPDNPEEDNTQLLSKELGDLIFSIDMCFELDDFDLDTFNEAFENRYDSIQKYLHFNKEYFDE